MLRRLVPATLVLLAALTVTLTLQPREARAQGRGQPTDWHRFYYYPYVYYSHNFQGPREFDHLYYRYPPDRRIPVYNKSWHNFYPSERPYYMGHHFILDVF